MGGPGATSVEPQVRASRAPDRRGFLAQELVASLAESASLERPASDELPGEYREDDHEEQEAGHTPGDQKLRFFVFHEVQEMPAGGAIIQVL
jgi:hypothetical protein